MKSSITIAFVLLTISLSYAQKEIAQGRDPERNGIYPEVNLLENWQ